MGNFMVKTPMRVDFHHFHISCYFVHKKVKSGDSVPSIQEAFWQTTKAHLLLAATR